MENISENVCAVILAAGKGTRLNSIINGLLKPLVKVNGCPAIVMVARSVIQQGVKDFVIVANETNKKAIEGVWNDAFSNLGLNLKIVVQPTQMGPAHALSFGVSTVDTKKHVLVCLADTLFDEEVPFDHDWVGTSNAIGSGKWCWVDHNEGKVIELYDKIQPPINVTDVLIGLYYFRDCNYLKECLNNVITNNIRVAEGEYQLSNVINLYKQKYLIKAHNISTWVDVGSVENYLDAQYKLIQHRSSNSFHINELATGKTITKQGQADKINNEINWILEVDKISPDIVLKLYDTTINSYEMDYCPDPLLSKIYLYEDVTPEKFGEIISNLLLVVNKGLWQKRSYTNKINIVKECKDMYVNKPTIRLAQWSDWNRFKNSNNLTINRLQITNIESRINKIAQYLASNHKPIVGIIHGDFHFGNIFYNEKNMSFKLIDPRGSFGEHKGIDGDIYYELAKLRHSYQGMYDSILDGLYTIEIDEQTFNIRFGPRKSRHINLLDNAISKLGYDLNIVKMIEFTILLSLIPIHHDSKNNQLAFFLQALLLSEEICNLE